MYVGPINGAFLLCLPTIEIHSQNVTKIKESEYEQLQEHFQKLTDINGDWETIETQAPDHILGTRFVCAVPIFQSLIFVFLSYNYAGLTYFYNIEENSWKKGPTLQVQRSVVGGCAVIRRPSTRFLLVSLI